jgi:FG-GAP-like repeat
MLKDRSPLPLMVCVAALLLCPACSSDPIGTTDGGGGEAGGDGGITFPDMSDGPKGPECKNNTDCKGGYCVGGACCPTKQQVCGEACCKTTETCFANACVTPGKICFSTADCDPGQYCEPALGAGGGDGGAADAGPQPDGKTCLKPAPSAGRCLKLPLKCSDAGAPAPDAGCIPACEYHPQAGLLNATVQWTWGPVAKQYKNMTDVWSTPAVGRVYDTNCDGKLDELDPPSVIVVSGDAKDTCCSCGTGNEDTCKTGVLRLLDGASGQEIWSLRKASSTSKGFAGVSVAIGDIDGDGRLEIAAVTGEGKVVLVDADGKLLRTSDKIIDHVSKESFGWGGALALGDMDGDGAPEIAYGSTVFTTKGTKLTWKFKGSGGIAGGATRAISTFVDLDGAANGHLELLAGNTAYKADGSILWQQSGLTDGFPGVGDFDVDGTPEVVLVSKRNIWLLAPKTGKIILGPLLVPGTTKENGGPPTVADFDGDGKPEIGVAMRQFYYAIKPNFVTKKLDVMWKTENHDLSSSVTGSTVFDFEGDGAAEVVYNDECFLWVYDGKTGKVRFATPTTSFTATEASLVADVDGDGHAEMLMISNGADPSDKGWKCDVAPWNKPDPKTGRPAWKPPAGATAYRGITLWRDKANSWVGSRTLWNQHTYHVSNICDHRDNACGPPNTYGLIPAKEKQNWSVSWLNNFRQNVQDKGIFDAPDATLDLAVDCKTPVVLHAYLRNYGFALLPAGVKVGFFIRTGASDVKLAEVTTSTPLFPGQIKELTYTLKSGEGTVKESYLAKVLIDPTNPTFHECRSDNNEAGPTKANCTLE